jgi:hypothetical protein
MFTYSIMSVYIYQISVYRVESLELYEIVAQLHV